MTPQEAYEKARALGKRMPELEGIILKDVYSSYWYARHIIEGRWELAEPAISKDAEYSFYYALNLIKGKWEKAEPAIIKNAYYSYLYARYVIEGRLPDFMHNQMILENNKYTKNYIEFIK